MVGNTIGGGSAYWTNWTVDAIGNRTEQVEHNLTGGTDTTTTYTYNGNGQNKPHTLTSTATSGGATGSASYTYDAAGNTTGRNAAQGNQALTWDDAGKLTGVTGGTSGDNTFIYDADGNLLIQKEPGKSILYLPGQQHTLNTTTGTISGNRYYQLPGGGTCIRSGTGTAYTFTITDHQGTPSLYLDNTAQNPTWRQYTPYGGARGATVNSPDNHGFLNKPMSPTGLSIVGARAYDTAVGRFVSVDPLQDLAAPQQWNGYAYSHNSPVTFSDPTGLIDTDCLTVASCPDYRWGDEKGNRKNKARMSKEAGKSCWPRCSGSKDLRKPERVYPFGTCAGRKREMCELNDDEAKAKGQLDGMLMQYGADPNFCLPLKLYCQYGGDRPGVHEIAMCRKMGMLDCKAMHEAFEWAEQLAGPSPKSGAKAFDPKWNAEHHSLWMALAVVNGVDPDDARLMGLAHELDGPATGAPRLGSVDSRIDLANNDAGIKIGMAARGSTPPGRGVSDRGIAAFFIHTALAQDNECIQLTCLHLGARP
ncbi:RHS repeat-associated core domain-containing protein [Micromonospora sp. WMMD812]|uniref:RHS repeat domain-containing protein n=1 Tax=Micromonospora sp. WMMD812 TaxID=3015152 RepID=UPI00248C19F3|nr:RHS repeat-associated core domain-containing protein [Micromonospora sp. WMMD812]WBB65215.1 hypothetical protein O7603_18560 [Micromonospora sp. WMMD812]